MTEQRANLDARLANARAQEKRLVEIVAGHKTGSVAEVLEVERELARVRESVERDSTRRSAGSTGEIDLATVTVHVLSPEEMAPTGGGAALSGASRARSTAGIKATGTLALYAAMAFAAVSPVLVPVMLLASAALLFARRRRRAQLAAMAAVMAAPAPKAVG